MLDSEQGTGNIEMKRTRPTFEVATPWETRHANGLLQSNQMQQAERETSSSRKIRWLGLDRLVGVFQVKKGRGVQVEKAVRAKAWRHETLVFQELQVVQYQWNINLKQSGIRDEPGEVKGKGR